jgi:sugar phosphate isomerase/epimerase
MGAGNSETAGERFMPRREHATVQVSIREGMTRGETLAEKLAWLESVGLDAVELHTTSMTLPPDEVIATFAASPISVSAIEGIPRLLDADPAQREAAKATIRERLDLASKLGAIGVLVVPQFGRVPALPDLTPFATGAQLERNLLLAQLRELAPAAAAAGVSVFLEPLNRYEAYIVNRLEQGSAISQEVGPQIGVMADFFHMGIEEADIPAAIRANADHLVYVHVADSNRLQPGRGHLDFRPGFRALKEIGYDGPLAIECRVDGPYDVAIRATVELIRGEWAKA